MDRFIGRKRELEELERRLGSDDFEFIVVYGRRRVGKTTLIEKAIDGKDCIFLQATSNDKYNLSELSLQIGSLFPDFAGVVNFNTYQEVFRFLSVKAKEEALILVIDEISYIAESDNSFLQILQNFVDHEFRKTKIKLVLSGSYVHFMESNVMGPQSPLFGRRTAAIKLEPFSIAESISFFPLWNSDEKAAAHILTGGVPSYLNLFAAFEDLKEALKNLFFNSMGLLYNEQRVLLNNSVRAVSNYEMILSAIASGTNKVTLIADKTGLDKANVSSLLHSLNLMGIVEEVISIAPKVRKMGWRIADGYYAFYYTFVYPSRNMIERNLSEAVVEHTMQNLNAFIGRRIEADFRNYVLGISGFLPDRYGFAEFGNPTTHQNEEIDLVAIDNEGRYLFGECKWKSEKVGIDVLEDLLRKSLLLNPSDFQLYICSKLGFTDSAIKFANQDKRYHLITGNELLGGVG